MSVDEGALAKLLLERGLLAQDEFDEAERERKASGRPLAEILVQKNFLSAPRSATRRRRWKSGSGSAPSARAPSSSPA